MASAAKMLAPRRKYEGGIGWRLVAGEMWRNVARRANVYALAGGNGSRRGGVEAHLVMA